jgi:hypothetical protein
MAFRGRVGRSGGELIQGCRSAAPRPGEWAWGEGRGHLGGCRGWTEVIDRRILVQDHGDWVRDYVTGGCRGSCQPWSKLQR